MKTQIAMIFFPKQIDLAKVLGVANCQITRFISHGSIPESYDKKLKREIKKKMKKLNRLAEEILK